MCDASGDVGVRVFGEATRASAHPLEHPIDDGSGVSGPLRQLWVAAGTALEVGTSCVFDGSVPLVGEDAVLVGGRPGYAPAAGSLGSRVL